MKGILRKMRPMKTIKIKDNEEVIIRRVTLKDLAIVFEIEKLSFRDPYPLDLLHTLAILNNETFLVAVHNEKVVGYVIGTLRWDIVGHIINIAVHPDFRGRGIGKALMIEVMKELRRKGAKIFRLEVRVSNVVAQKLYESLGFRKSYTIPNYYSDGEACYVMFKRD